MAKGGKKAAIKAGRAAGKGTRGTGIPLGMARTVYSHALSEHRRSLTGARSGYRGSKVGDVVSAAHGRGQTTVFGGEWSRFNSIAKSLNQRAAARALRK